MRAVWLVLMLASMTRGAYADEVKVDWARGLVIADGVGVADRHAPSPAVARGTSRRAAEDRARAAIRAAIGKLPVASGGTVPDKAAEAALVAAFALDAEPETDGAWRVTMAVPIESVRQAFSGPRKLPADGDAGQPVVVIEGATAKPAVGWKVGSVEAATIWTDSAPAWAKDAPHVHAKSAKAGVIELDRMAGGPATLFVVLRYRP
jgi:hypothetical protein